MDGAEQRHVIKWRTEGSKEPWTDWYISQDAAAKIDEFRKCVKGAEFKLITRLIIDIEDKQDE